jgi:membrane protein implicated in regulation of membrane protease activity
MLDFDMDYSYWVVGGFLLMALEMFVPGIFLLWIGLAGVIVGGLSYGFDAFPLWGQLVAFGGFSLGLAFLGPLINTSKVHEDPNSLSLNQKGKSLMGKEFILDVDLMQGKGHATIENSKWLVTCSEDLMKGTKVRIMNIDGIILKIEKV